MADSLEINSTELKDKVSKLSEALNDMNESGRKRFSEDLSNLDEMNTDFTAKLKSMIQNINSDYRDVIKRVQKEINYANKIVEELEKADNKMARQIKDGD